MEKKRNTNSAADTTIPIASIGSKDDTLPLLL
jgi:hypothetical protein